MAIIKYLVACLALMVSSSTFAVNCAKNPTHPNCGEPVSDLTTRVEALETSVSELTTRIESLEASALDVENLKARLAEQDFDGDGFSPATNDCDDSNYNINPSAYEFAGTPEASDGVDNDCDGAIDNAYTDLDGDGHYAGIDDCDDQNPDVYSGNPSWYYDNVDHNCNDSVEYEYTTLYGWYSEFNGLFYNCMVVEAGWVNTVPACGQTGRYLDPGMISETVASTDPNQCSSLLEGYAANVTQRCR